MACTGAPLGVGRHRGTEPAGQVRRRRPPAGHQATVAACLQTGRCPLNERSCAVLMLPSRHLRDERSEGVPQAQWLASGSVRAVVRCTPPSRRRILATDWCFRPLCRLWRWAASIATPVRDVRSMKASCRLSALATAIRRMGVEQRRKTRHGFQVRRGLGPWPARIRAGAPAFTGRGDTCISNS